MSRAAACSAGTAVRPVLARNNYCGYVSQERFLRLLRSRSAPIAPRPRKHEGRPEMLSRLAKPKVLRCSLRSLNVLPPRVGLRCSLPGLSVIRSRWNGYHCAGFPALALRLSFTSTFTTRRAEACSSALVMPPGLPREGRRVPSLRYSRACFRDSLTAPFVI